MWKMPPTLWIAAHFALMTPVDAQVDPSRDPVTPAQDDPFTQMEVLTRAMEIIRQNYVDPDKVTYADLIEGALEGMLRKLDPHCEFMGRSLFEDMRKEQTDTSEGVGITVALRSAVLTIITVRSDGPAARAGVLGGDQIVRIDDVLTDTVGVVECVQLLKGNAGEPLRLTVRRPGTQQFLEFKMIRETFVESSVHNAMLLHPKLAAGHRIGYVRISQFTQPTVRDLSQALDNLEKQGMTALVLDLRNNPGGLLDGAVGVCGEFLPDGTLVVTTEGRSASDNPPPYRTPKRFGKPPRRYPMAVLVNQGSASAAEIVAGALQDLKRALVVGTTSFGKGSVQTILPLSTGAAMRLTTAKYYTPSHRTIHEHGVEPNIVSTLTTKDELEINKWRASHGTGEAAALELASLGDRQLERAVDALKGVLVYADFAKTTPPPAAPQPPTVKPAPAPSKPAPAKPAQTPAKKQP
jgi:carboxyl-terminal processing protease